jgi:hypothetical protein
LVPLVFSGIRPVQVINRAQQNITAIHLHARRLFVISVLFRD